MFIQNNPAEGPGMLQELFDKDGLDTTIVGAEQRVPQSAHGPVVILGGPQGANDDSRRLRDQEKLIAYCHRNQVPLLGICLGSQLAARALGGRVYRGAREEIGFYGDVRPDTGSALFQNAPEPYWVFHWHHDTFDIPPGARRLAESPLYRNQAFVSGSVVGVQFHLEVDHSMVEEWLGLAGRDAAAHDAGRVRDTAANMKLFYGNFKRMFKI